MKRWVVCTLGDYENDGTRVPKTNLYLATGEYNDTDFSLPRCHVRLWSKPGFNVGFGQLAIKRVDIMQADPDIILIPDAAMDNALSSIPSNVRTALKARLEGMGLDYSSAKATWTVRRLLIHLKNQVINTVSDSVEDGDVRDIEA